MSMSGLDGPSGSRSSRGRGFTLIELLTVIAIVAILSTIVFGLGRRVSESGRISRTGSELATISVALERYRQVHGDYPRTDDAAQMLQALIGRRDPLMNAIQRRALLDLAAFVTEMQRDPFTDEGARLVDAWGHPYHYAYRTIGSWTNASYVLYSAGSDGAASPALLAGGYPDQGASENHDNIYANR
jgi:prepilin-type N-terminal cleavage/methylation domain-containing protein